MFVYKLQRTWCWELQCCTALLSLCQSLLWQRCSQTSLHVMSRGKLTMFSYVIPPTVTTSPLSSDNLLTNASKYAIVILQNIFLCCATWLWWTLTQIDSCLDILEMDEWLMVYRSIKAMWPRLLHYSRRSPTWWLSHQTGVFNGVVQLHVKPFLLEA